MHSVEIILLYDGGKIIFRNPLSWCGHSLELCESLWIVNALLEKIKLWFTDSHLSIEPEKALSSIVEWLEADWLESEVL